MNSKTSNAGSAARQAPDSCKSNQFQWMRQVAFDSELPPVASRVAIALTKYFNRKHGGWSWMSQDTLAIDLGISVRTVISALAALVDRGHLICRRRGREETNLYRLALKESDLQEIADHPGGVICKSTSSDLQKNVKVICKNLQTNPIKEPNEEPNIARRAKARPRSSLSGGGRGTPISTAITEPMLARALERAAWGPDQAKLEFEKFRNRCLSKGTRSQNWDAEWAIWVERGIEHQPKRTKREGPMIDQDGNPVAPPSGSGRPRRQSNRERGRAMFGGAA